MPLFLVHKSQPDIGAPEVLGVFTSRIRAKSACVGPGIYDIFDVTPDRVYRSGTLRDIERIIIVGLAQVKE